MLIRPEAMGVRPFRSSQPIGPDSYDIRAHGLGAFAIPPFLHAFTSRHRP